MKAVYIPVGATGHILASLPMIGELVKKGVEVLYFAPERYRAQVEVTGAKFSPIPVVAGQDSVDAGDDFLAGIPLVFLGEAAGVIDHILPVAETFAPDVVINDPLALAGRIVAKVLDKPLVMLHTTYVSNEHFSMCRFWPVYPDTNPARAKAHEISAAFTEKYGVKHMDVYEIFEGRGDYNLCTLSKSFQPAGDTFGDDFYFVGAQIAKRADSGTWQPPTNGKPLLYTSLGSLFNNWPEFYQMLFPVVKDMDINVICSIGSVLKPEDLGDIPENVTVMPFTPQLEVLANTDYFITHAGVGSVMEALYYGVPSFCVPQMDEQVFTAGRMMELKIASSSFQKHELTEEKLRTALEELISNPVYKQNAEAMAKEMHDNGGCERAAQAVIDYVNSL